MLESTPPERHADIKVYNTEDWRFEDASQLFDAAAATGRTVELDLAAVESVAAGARNISKDHILTINLSAKSLEVKEFDAGWLLKTLRHHEISPGRVVLELTERDPITDVATSSRSTSRLSRVGHNMLPRGRCCDPSGTWRGDRMRSSPAKAWSNRSSCVRCASWISRSDRDTLGVPGAEPDIRPRDLASLAAAGTVEPMLPAERPTRSSRPNVPSLPRAPELPAQPLVRPAISLAPGAALTAT